MTRDCGHIASAVALAGLTVGVVVCVLVRVPDAVAP